MNVSIESWVKIVLWQFVSYWCVYARNTLITLTSSKYLIRYLHINWVANQVFNTSNSNVLGSLHVNVNVNVARAKHTGPSYKPYCMPSLTVALLLLEWLHDGVYAGRSVCFVCRARDKHLHYLPTQTAARAAIKSDC